MRKPKRKNYFFGYMFLLLFIFVNFLSLGIGVLDSRSCGFFSQRKCTSTDGILDSSRWRYILPGYNAGIILGVFMNQKEE